MKTEAELKNLAEFAAEFLGLKNNSWCWLNNKTLHVYFCEMNLFEYFNTAPILAHLAKREMEKRGYKIKFSNNINCDDLNARYIYSITADIHDDHPKQFSDNNEYIALWSAIEEAVG